MIVPDDNEVIVICGPASYFGDDVKSRCELCGADVFLRPSAPDGKHVCFACFVKQMAACGQFEIVVTPETAREAVEYIRAERANRKEGAN